MEMNVSSTTSAYTSAAASYDGYEVDKDLATKIKEEAAKSAETKTGMPSEEFLQEQAAIFERSEVKSFLGQFSRDTVCSLDKLGQSLFTDMRISMDTAIEMMHLENFIRRVYLTEQNSTRKHMQICMMRLNVDMLTEQEKRL